MSTGQIRVLLIGLVILAGILVFALLLALFARTPSGQAQAIRSGDDSLPATTEISVQPTVEQAELPPTVGAPTGQSVDSPTHSPTDDVPAPTGNPTATSQQQSAGDASGTTQEFDLSPGVYRIFFSADASVDELQPLVTDGECSQHPLFVQVPGPFTASTTYRSTGCRVQFDVVGTDGSWTLDLQAAADSIPLAPPVVFEGNSASTTDPVVLPEGEYRLVLDTQSPYSMVVPVIVEGLCLERPVFLNTQPGQFETTYHSTGCDVVFQVSNVTAGWQLSIQAGT